MARIFKRNNVWYIDYLYKGRRYRRRVSKSKKVAKIALSDIEVKIDREDVGLVVKRNVTFERLAEEYLKYSKANKSQSSYQRDVQIIKIHAIRYFGGRLLREITPKMVEGYVIKRASEVQESTVNRELNTNLNMFNKAVQWDYLKESPGKGIKKLKESSSRAPEFLSEGEISSLLQSCPERIFPLVFTAIYTGCRQSELFNLKWEDINFEKNQIVIQSKEDWHTKSYRYRVIPIDDDLKYMLAYLKENSNGREYVFPALNGGKLNKNQIRRSYMKAVKTAGINSTDFKILRHTYASHLVMRGINIRTVQKLLGHHSVKVTEKYSHLAPDHLQSIAQQLTFGKESRRVGTNMAQARNGRSQSVVPLGVRVLNDRPFTAATRVQISLGTLFLSKPIKSNPLNNKKLSESNQGRPNQNENSFFDLF
jgi:integrase